MSRMPHLLSILLIVLSLDLQSLLMDAIILLTDAIILLTDAILIIVLRLAQSNLLLDSLKPPCPLARTGPGCTGGVLFRPTKDTLAAPVLVLTPTLD